MRIVSGQYKGRIINPPRNLRARPTTDFAKENLFNVLTGFGFDYSECDVLDLFAGTGSVSYEFASRGARSVTSVEINAVHYAFIRRTASELGFDGRDGRSNLIAVKANVFNYLRACTRRFDIIFSDAPYDLSGSEEVIELVFERGLLRREGDVREDGTVAEEGGLLIFEHSRGHDFSTHPHFLQTRSYGSVQFSLFG
jgi:16S rRNA (guanine(966)-N(2))-methyltransferase RsmD